MAHHVAAVRAHALSRDVTLQRRGRYGAAFVDGGTGQTLRGLLPVLARAFPCPDHGPADCPACRPSAKRRATPAATGIVPSKRRIRRGHFVPVHTPDTLTRCCGASSMAHGSVVDADMQRWVRGEPLRDQCAGTLAAYIEGVCGWRPVAAQVPVRAPSLGPRVCTAIDLVCTDAATGTQFIVVEVKATRGRTDRPDADIDACYRCSVETVRTLPMSRYMQHQLQLWAMVHALHHDYGMRVDAAVVLRTSPGRVMAYPLMPSLQPASGALVRRVTTAVRSVTKHAVAAEADVAVASAQRP